MEEKNKKLVWIKLVIIGTLLSVATLAVAGYQFYDYFLSVEADRRLLKEGHREIPIALNMEAVKRIRRGGNGRTPLRFVVLGDSHQDFETLQKLIDHAMMHQPDFIVHTEDFTNNGRAFEYFKTVSFLKTVAVPVIMTPGNHDMDNYGFRLFARIFGPPNFFFDIGECRFIFLNNVQRSISNDLIDIHNASTFSGDLSRGLDLQILSFIELLIRESSRVFIIMHMPPPVPSFDFYCFTRNGETFIDLMSRYSSHISRVLFGHIHGYGKTTFKDVIYIEAGGAGPVRDINTNRNGILPNKNYVLITVNPDGVADEVFFIE
ncbi:MAG: metallophosphoesterase [Desulfobacterota bacterium]|nr:metallophosphoesterase [Thermodesulfobacteriota bacterium]